MAFAAGNRRGDVGARRYSLDPVQVVMHFRVDTRSAFSATTVSIRRYTYDNNGNFLLFSERFDTTKIIVKLYH